LLSLGLDISTSRTGYSIIENKKILDFGYIDSSKEEDIYSKAKFVIDKLNQLISN
jgi:Holliday junction resolvasome RuvABC endonuclease subunit